MKYVVLLLLSLKIPFEVASEDLKPHEFDSFKIEFNSSCTAYLYMYNIEFDQHLYLNQEDGKINLVILTGQSYETYSMSWSDKLVFGWPQKTINEKELLKVNVSGTLNEPLRFNISDIYCKITGFSASKGTLADTSPLLEPAECQVYKCPKNKEWKLYVPLLATFVMMAFVVALCYLADDQTLLRHKICRLLKWTRLTCSRRNNQPSCQRDNCMPMFASKV